MGYQLQLKLIRPPDQISRVGIFNVDCGGRGRAEFERSGKGKISEDVAGLEITWGTVKPGTQNINNYFDPWV